MRHKLKGADGVSHALEVVALSVSEVIHRISVPFRASAMMRYVDDTIDYWVAEVHVGICHVQLRPQHHRAFNSIGSVHQFEQSQTLLHGTVAVWAGNARCGGRAFLLCYLLRGLLVNVSQAFLYQPYGKVPQLLEVVGSIIDISPLESKPFYVVKY